jgi:hypothetical protein
MDCLPSELKCSAKLCSASAWEVGGCQLFCAQIETCSVVMLIFCGACSWFWRLGYPLLLAVVCAHDLAGWTLQFFSIDARLYHGSDGQLPACHCRGPGSIPGQSHLGFVVDKVALGWVFLPALQFSPVSIIPPLLHTHSFIYHPYCIIMFL